MKPTINIPYIGCHVWSEHGNPSHGPEHGPKVAIPAKSLGTIIASHEQFAAPDLVTVQWCDGTISKHYFYELYCIGPFDSLEGYHHALGEARGARLWRGPRGGFQMFTAEVLFQGEFYPVQFGKKDKALFDCIEPILHSKSTHIDIVQAPKR